MSAGKSDEKFVAASGVSVADGECEPGTSAGGISRRGFVAAGVAGAALVGLGGFGAVTGQADVALVRPPGAADGARFAALCNRCGKCYQACPYEIVSQAPLSRGLVSYGTPELAFERGACDFCMKCVDTCPTGALSTGVDAERDCGIAVVVRDACVAWNWMGCTLCHDKCPVEGAITLDSQNRPVVHADVCDGCGICENVCPSASVRAYNADAASLGIVVVSRASETAASAFRSGAAGEALSGDEVERGRNRVAEGRRLAPHSKGVHPAGPYAVFDAATGVLSQEGTQP